MLEIYKMFSDPLQIKLAEFLVSHSIYFLLGPLNVLMDINGPEWVYKADLFIYFLIMSEEVFLFYFMSVLFLFVYLFYCDWGIESFLDRKQLQTSENRISSFSTVVFHKTAAKVTNLWSACCVHSVFRIYSASKLHWCFPITYSK